MLRRGHGGRFPLGDGGNPWLSTSWVVDRHRHRFTVGYRPAALAADFQANQEAIRTRAAALGAQPELQAREVARAAPVALITFRIAYEQWIAEPGGARSAAA